VVSCGVWGLFDVVVDIVVVLDVVLDVVVVEVVVGGWGVRREGEASRPLSVREGRARVRVCVMYYQSSLVSGYCS
jgi:hypothetical protein